MIPYATDRDLPAGPYLVYGSAGGGRSAASPENGASGSNRGSSNDQGGEVLKSVCV